MHTASDSGKESLGMRFQKGQVRAEEAPVATYSGESFTLPRALGPAPALAPGNPEHQDPPCQETLSHPLIPNYLFPLKSLHLVGGAGGGVTQWDKGSCYI